MWGTIAQLFTPTLIWFKQDKRAGSVFGRERHHGAVPKFNLGGLARSRLHAAINTSSHEAQTRPAYS